MVRGMSKVGSKVGSGRIESGWFHVCPMSGPTTTGFGEECCDCGAVERRSRQRMRAILRCVEGGRKD